MNAVKERLEREFLKFLNIRRVGIVLGRGLQVVDAAGVVKLV